MRGMEKLREHILRIWGFDRGFRGGFKIWVLAVMVCRGVIWLAQRRPSLMHNAVMVVVDLAIGGVITLIPLIHRSF